MQQVFSSLDHTVQETNVWLKDVQEEMNLETRQEAYNALRAVLHTLRTASLRKSRSSWAPSFHYCSAGSTMKAGTLRRRRPRSATSAISWTMCGRSSRSSSLSTR